MRQSPGRPVAIKIGPEIRERVKRLAEARQRTPHWLMREAQYGEREEKREALRRDAMMAWNRYRAIGLHVMAGRSRRLDCQAGERGGCAAA